MLLQFKFIIAIVIAGLLFFSYNWIERNAVNRYVAKQAIIQQKADDEQQAKYNTLAESFESMRHNQQVVTKLVEKKVTKIIEKPIYRNICIDSEGVDEANKALKGGSNG